MYWHSLTTISDGKFHIQIANLGDFSFQSMACGGGHRYSGITTNQSEVFNKVLKGALSLPITEFVELTLTRLNTYFINCRVRYEKKILMGNNFLPKERMLLSSTKENSRFFSIENYLYGEQYKVSRCNAIYCKLPQMLFNYVEWTLFQQTCPHAMTTIQHTSSDLKVYVDSHLGVHYYMWTCLPKFYPLPGPYWYPTWNDLVVWCDPNMLISKHGCRKFRTPNRMDSQSYNKRSCEE